MEINSGAVTEQQKLNCDRPECAVLMELRLASRQTAKTTERLDSDQQNLSSELVKIENQVRVARQVSDIQAQENISNVLQMRADQSAAEQRIQAQIVDAEQIAARGDAEYRGMLQTGYKNIRELFEKSGKNINAKFTQVDAKFATMDDKMNNLEKNINAKFTQVDAKFAEMDDKINNLEKNINAKFTQVDAKFAKMDAKLDKMEGQITELASSLKTVVRFLERFQPPQP